jgi:hypothetical protein
MISTCLPASRLSVAVIHPAGRGNCGIISGDDPIVFRHVRRLRPHADVNVGAIVFRAIHRFWMFVARFDDIADEARTVDLTGDGTSLSAPICSVDFLA